MSTTLFFIKDIPLEYDYHRIYNFFNKHGPIKDFKVVYNSKMTFIDFIFLKYRDERSAFYLKSYISCIDNQVISFRTQCHKEDVQDKGFYIEKINEIKNKIKTQHFTKYTYKDDNLFFSDREKWRKKIENIDKILKDL